MRVLALNDRKELRQFVGHTGKVSAVSFSPPDGKYLLSASERASFSRLWEVATGREVGKFQGSTDEGTGALFSPDGRSGRIDYYYFSHGLYSFLIPSIPSGHLLPGQHPASRRSRTST